MPEDCTSASIDKLFAVIVSLLEDADCVEELEFSDSAIQFEILGLEYLINKRTCSNQVWLSSAKIGAYHFFLKDGEWKEIYYYTLS